MKTRYVLAGFVMTLLAASQVSASIIAASSEYRRAQQPAERVTGVDAVSVQNDLNEALRGVGDESAMGTLSGAHTPKVTAGGFMITSDGGSAVSYVGTGSPMDGVLGSGVGNASPGLSGGDFSGLSPGSGGRGGQGNNGRYGNRDGRREMKDKGRRGDQGRGRHSGGGETGGVQVAPEPSTWLLLASGLALLGAYGVMRRRQSVNG